MSPTRSQTLTAKAVIKTENLPMDEECGPKLKMVMAPGSPALFHVTLSEVRELLCVGGKHRSWFIDDGVVSDGSLTISSPINPLFLCLQYLIDNASSHFCPLDQILMDEDYPDIARLSLLPNISEKINKICDVKELNAELVVYRLNSEKLIEYLVDKVHKLRKVLVEMGDMHQNILQSDSALLRYSWGIMCDYIPVKISHELQLKLNIVLEIEQITKEPEIKKRKLGDLEGPVEPTENYHDQKKIPIKKKVETTKEKQLKQAASGTKTIMTFFNKKNT